MPWAWACSARSQPHPGPGPGLSDTLSFHLAPQIEAPSHHFSPEEVRMECWGVQKGGNSSLTSPARAGASFPAFGHAALVPGVAGGV